jgi:hypothetical protein
MGACELRRGLYMHVHQRGNRAEGGFGDGFGVLRRNSTPMHTKLCVCECACVGIWSGAAVSWVPSKCMINLRHRHETGGINYHLPPVMGSPSAVPRFKFIQIPDFSLIKFTHVAPSRRAYD